MWTKLFAQGGQPPELEQLFKRFFSKPTQTPSPTPENPNQLNITQLSRWIAPILLLIILLLWGFSGVYSVSSNESAVVIHLGQFKKIENTGTHWYPRFIDQVDIVQVKSNNPLSLQTTVLTQDDNEVQVKLAADYTISNVQTFLLQQSDAMSILQSMLNTAATQALGDATLNALLDSHQQTLIESQMLSNVQAQLLKNPIGIDVNQVTLQTVALPDSVTDSYSKVQKAQEAVAKKVTEAQAYADALKPVAAEKSKALIQSAQAYQKQVALATQAETIEFQALLPVYKQYPEVTKTRLYFDTMEPLFKKAHLILAEEGVNVNVAAPALMQPGSKTKKKKNQTDDTTTHNTAQKEADYIRWGEAQQ